MAGGLVAAVRGRRPRRSSPPGGGLERAWGWSEGGVLRHQGEAGTLIRWLGLPHLFTTKIQTDRQTDRQTHREAGRQASRQASSQAESRREVTLVLSYLSGRGPRTPSVLIKHVDRPTEKL